MRIVKKSATLTTVARLTAHSFISWYVYSYKSDSTFYSTALFRIISFCFLSCILYYVVCAFVICLIKYLLTYLLTSHDARESLKNEKAAHLGVVNDPLEETVLNTTLLKT